MLKISTAAKDIIENQQFLRFGLHHKLFNLSNLAKFIKPLIEARVKKEIKSGAVTMYLSRLRKEKLSDVKITNDLPIINISIHSNLSCLSFFTSREVYNKIDSIYAEIQKKNGYVSVIQGINETALVIDENFINVVNKFIKQKPRSLKTSVSALSVQLDETFCDTLGLLYTMIQKITFQGINIYAISSTFTEMIVYVAQNDIKLVFDTMYSSFSKNGAVWYGEGHSA